MSLNEGAMITASESVLSTCVVGSSILQVRDLRTSLLKSASFSLSAGECVAVRGPSGAGKTLLLRAIADLDPGAAWSAMCRPSQAGGRSRSASTSASGWLHLHLSDTWDFRRRRRLGRSPA